MRERLARRPVLAASALCAAALVPFSPALAGPARATFLFVGEDGQRQQETLSEVRYGYFVRRFLNVRLPETPQSAPSSPLPHKDRALRKRSLLLQDEKIPLYTVRSIECSWRASDTPGTEVLVLRVTLQTGLELDVKGSDLRGFESFSPPFLEGKKDDATLRFPLPPFRREGEAGAPPLLEKVVFHSRSGPRGAPRPRS